jgi:DNA-binding YbaB/EbfC family protein
MGKGMKAGKRPGNPAAKGAQVQQMLQMQGKIEKMRAAIEEKEVESTAGGGAVEVKVNGKKELVSLKISPDAMDPEDVEMLQDLILVAVNEALRQIDELTESEMEKITGGIPIPGLM